MLNKNTTIAKNDNSSLNIKDTMIIQMIPNNLDSFNVELRSYCYDNNIKLHKGIISSERIFKDKLALLVLSADLDKEIIKIDLYKGSEDLALIDEVLTHENKDELINEYNLYEKIYDSRKKAFESIIADADKSEYSDIIKFIENSVLLKDIEYSVIFRYLVENDSVNFLSKIKYTHYALDEGIEFIKSLETVLENEGADAVIDKLDAVFLSNYSFTLYAVCKDSSSYVNEDLSKLLQQYTNNFRYPELFNLLVKSIRYS